MANFKWRVRTEAEFINHYGENWRDIVPLARSLCMDDFFSKIVDDATVTEINNPKLFSNPKVGIFHLSRDMFTIEPLPKEESDEIKYDWRFKTETEFVNEYGSTWKVDASWNKKGEMDHLFGLPIREDQMKNFKNYGFFMAGGFTINAKMITSFPLPPRTRSVTLKSKALSQFRVKTKAEFIDEFGKTWRDSCHHGGGISFPEVKDIILGMEVNTDNFPNISPRTGGGYNLGSATNFWSLTPSMIIPVINSESEYINLISNQTKQNGKATNNSVKVQGPTVLIQRGTSYKGSAICGGRKESAVTVRHLSNKAVSSW